MRQRLIALALAAATAHASEAATITFADPANGDYRLVSAANETHQIQWLDTSFNELPPDAVIGTEAELIVHQIVNDSETLGGVSLAEWLTQQGFGVGDITPPQLYDVPLGLEPTGLGLQEHWIRYDTLNQAWRPETEYLDLGFNGGTLDWPAMTRHYAVVTPLAVPEPSAIVLLVNPVLAIVSGRYRRRIRAC